MKQSSKERLATLLMDELLERLSERESIRKMLGDMASLPINEVVEHLLAEFARAVEDYHFKNHNREKPGKQVAEPPSVDVVRHERAALLQHSNHEPEIAQAADPGAVPPVSELKDVVEKSPERPPLPRGAALMPPAETSHAIGSPVAMPPKGPNGHLEQQQSKKSVDQVEPTIHKTEAPEKTLQLDPIRLEFPKITLKVDLPQSPPPSRTVEAVPQGKEVPRHQPKKQAQQKPELVNQEEELRRLEELAKKIEVEYAERLNKKLRDEQESLERAKVETVESPTGDESKDPDAVEAAIINDEEEELVHVEPVGSGKHLAHARYTFADDDFVYVHAVSKIPDNEEPSPDPFMLEEKGIDGHGFAFALDYEGMRFYLSKINPHEMSISKAMVLLLNKQESMQFQGVHESILNDLRGHGVLLPLEFGTVARGKDQLFDIIDKNKDDLEEALDDIVRTTTWTVTASVLDGTIAGIVGTEVQAVGRDRSRERASYTSAPQLKKFDIKVLERILQREKKIAEAVHAELSAVAENSDVETMVGLGSGSSEDWKVILKASYEVAKRDIGKFSRAVTDLQYHHLQYDLMLSLTGDRDFLTLRRK
jgi:hypothetical protein